jgi:hypothetical protein
MKEKAPEAQLHKRKQIKGRHHEAVFLSMKAGNYRH